MADRRGRNRHQRSRSVPRPREATDPRRAIGRAATGRLSAEEDRRKPAVEYLKPAIVGSPRATRSAATGVRGAVAGVARRHRLAARTTFDPGRPS